jgi:hypothetical protein
LHTGRLGGLYTVYAESSQARTEWKDKLQEAIGLRKVVQESNKVFEVETLSSDTFVVPSMLAVATNHAWNTDSALTGKVTCSVPFSKQFVSTVHISSSDLGRLTYLQPPRMGALSLPLAAQKVSGSGSAMILDVRCAFLSCCTVSESLLAAMRRVLHVKMVTQCAMLEDFGIFLVLADKVKVPSYCPNHHDLILSFL